MAPSKTVQKPAAHTSSFWLSGIPLAGVSAGLVAAVWSILSLLMPRYGAYLPPLAAVLIVLSLYISGIYAGKRRALLAAFLFIAAAMYQCYLFGVGTLAAEFGLTLSEAFTQIELEVITAVIYAHMEASQAVSYGLALTIALVLGYFPALKLFARR